MQGELTDNRNSRTCPRPALGENPIDFTVPRSATRLYLTHKTGLSGVFPEFSQPSGQVHNRESLRGAGAAPSPSSPQRVYQGSLTSLKLSRTNVNKPRLPSVPKLNSNSGIRESGQGLKTTPTGSSCSATIWAPTRCVPTAMPGQAVAPFTQTSTGGHALPP